MSTHAYLLLLFLCISLHACNARHLNSLDKKKLDEKKPHLSIKIDDKIGFDSSPKKHIEGDDNNTKSEFVGDYEKTKNKRSANKRVGKSRVSSQAESLVSWHVPHKNKKRSQKHIPWFTLDYSPPKTHPPSHN